MSAEHRRHHRYAVELPVRIREGQRVIDATVKNVSFDGVLVHASNVPTVRRLIRLELDLPGDLGSIQLTAMAVHVLPGTTHDNGKAVGIQMFGLDTATRNRWDRFIVDLRSGKTTIEAREFVPEPVRVAPEAPEASEDPAAPVVPDAAPAPEGSAKRPRPAEPTKPRILEAGPAELRVLLDSSTSVESVCAFIRNQDELLIRTDVRIGLGRPVLVTLVHPQTHEAVSLPGRVRRQCAEIDFVGLSVLVSVDDAELAALDAFQEGQPRVSITIELDSVDLVGLEGMISAA